MEGLIFGILRYVQEGLELCTSREPGGYSLIRAYWRRAASKGMFFEIFVLNRVSMLSFFGLIRVSILSIFVLN